MFYNFCDIKKIEFNQKDRNFDLIDFDFCLEKIR